MSRVYYSALLTFGKETPTRGMLNPDHFADLIQQFIDLLKPVNVGLRYRGEIEGELGKNVAPRGGAFSPKIIASWSEAIKLRHPEGAMSFELYDKWPNELAPNIYCSITTLDPQSNASAGNNVTIAFSHNTRGLSPEWPKAILESLRDHSGMFYGYFETQTEWSLPWYGTNPLPSWMMDRYRDVIRTHFTDRKTYSLGKYLYRLYDGIIVSQRHLKADIQTVAKAGFIRECVPIGKSLWYVTTNQHLLKSPAAQAQAAELFNMFTPDDLDV